MAKRKTRSKYKKVVQDFSLFTPKTVDLSASTVSTINEMRLAFLQKELEILYDQGGMHAVALFFVRSF